MSILLLFKNTQAFFKEKNCGQCVDSKTFLFAYVYKQNYRQSRNLCRNVIGYMTYFYGNRNLLLFKILFIKLGYRLMVGHQVLVLSIEVRVLVPQLCKEEKFC